MLPKIDSINNDTSMLEFTVQLRVLRFQRIKKNIRVN